MLFDLSEKRGLLFAALAILFSSFVCFSAIASDPAERADNHATILLYHHVSSDTPPSTSISTSQFEAHLQYLQENHVVLPLTEIISSLQDGKPIPDKAIAITFDDGYHNILENAHPLLQRFKMPYTIFISPDIIGAQSDQLTWEQVKLMAKQGVTFANHSSKHDHLLTQRDGESQKQWLSRVIGDIEKAEKRLLDELGYSLKWIAYPYGEYNLLLRDELVARGYVGFGQHSGGVDHKSDFGALPRFPAAGIYANLATLTTKANSLAMPISSASHEPLRVLNEQPEIAIKLDTSKLKPTRVTCFYNNKPIPLEVTDVAFVFKLPKPLGVGRSRVNCTAPSGKTGRFYWFSQAFVVPTENGVFID